MGAESPQLVSARPRPNTRLRSVDTRGTSVSGKGSTARVHPDSWAGAGGTESALWEVEGGRKDNLGNPGGQRSLELHTHHPSNAPEEGLAAETRGISPPRPRAARAEPTTRLQLSIAWRCRSPHPQPRPRRGARSCGPPAPSRPRRRSPCPGRAPGGAASEPASSAPPGGRCNSRTRRRGLIRGRSRRRCPSPGSPCRSLASRQGSPASWCQCLGRRGPGSP